MSAQSETKAGKLIFLHGASSSGKSTIARRLQATIDQPFWHISIDHLRDSGVLPMERIRNGEFPWKDLRDAFFSGYHRSLPVYAAAGNNLIVEHIIDTRKWLALLIDQLSPFDVFFVGIHCPLEELERRERARNDRPIGDARRDFATVHKHMQYDFEIDSTRPIAETVTALLNAWKQRQQPSAFEQMAAARATRYDTAVASSGLAIRGSPKR